MNRDDQTVHYVRQEFLPEEVPPIRLVGPWAWIRNNLLSTPGNIILTALGLWLSYIIIDSLLSFLIFNAIWTGESREDCLVDTGACWPYIIAFFGRFIYGMYPGDEIWRVNIVFFLFAVLLVPALIPSISYKRSNVFALLVVFPIVSFFLLYGGFGLAIVETRLWGGLLITLVIAVTGIVASLPIGIMLALGRRSHMPIVRLVSVIFVEFWRGVPLITILFMSSVVLPLFLPEDVTIDKLLRPLVGVALFAAAYMAEVVRGGLQAIPKGQYEAAYAMGLRYWQMMFLVILPQALKLVIPGIVNSFISLFKDTTLVLIIGLFDLLGMVQLSFNDPYWAVPQQSHTGYLVVAAMFWVFCFGMSRYSIYMERRLDTSHRAK